VYCLPSSLLSSASTKEIPALAILPQDSLLSLSGMSGPFKFGFVAFTTAGGYILVTN
jgi:hypothetical protein